MTLAQAKKRARELAHRNDREYVVIKTEEFGIMVVSGDEYDESWDEYEILFSSEDD